MPVRHQDHAGISVAITVTVSFLLVIDYGGISGLRLAIGIDEAGDKRVLGTTPGLDMSRRPRRHLSVRSGAEGSANIVLA